MLIVVSALAAPWSRPAHAEGPRLVIVDLEPVALPVPHDKTNLAQELASAATRAGCEVVRICRAPQCRPADAAASTQANLLSLTGRYQASRFTCSLAIELRRLPGGGPDSRTFSENPVCPAVQLVQDAREAGRRVCAELQSPAAGTRPAVPGNEPAPRAPPALNLTVSGDAPSAPWTARRWLGLGTATAGLGLGALGVFQALEHGDPTRCSTSSLGERVCTGAKQRPLAIPLMVLGAAGLGWGLWEATLGFGATHQDGLTMVTAGGQF